MASAVRHDWYQSEQKVVINVLIKNAAEQNCSVDIQARTVSVKCDDNVNLHLDLLYEINPSESNYRISPVKIEINLKKLCGDRWDTLTRSTDSVSQPKSISSPSSNQIDTEPASSNQAGAKAKAKNWDRLVKDIYEKEDIEKVSRVLMTALCVKVRQMNQHFVCVCFYVKQADVDPLNNLFQKIYSESNPEIQRAMNKSFTESGK